MSIISEFWLSYAAGAPLGPTWCERSEDDAIWGNSPDVDPLDELSMRDWLKLPNSEHAQIVADYTGSTRPIRLPVGMGAPPGARGHKRVSNADD